MNKTRDSTRLPPMLQATGTVMREQLQKRDQRIDDLLKTIGGVKARILIGRAQDHVEVREVKKQIALLVQRVSKLEAKRESARRPYRATRSYNPTGHGG